MIVAAELQLDIDVTFVERPADDEMEGCEQQGIGKRLNLRCRNDVADTSEDGIADAHMSENDSQQLAHHIEE